MDFHENPADRVEFLLEVERTFGQQPEMVQKAFRLYQQADRDWNQIGNQLLSRSQEPLANVDAVLLVGIAMRNVNARLALHFAQLNARFDRGPEESDIPNP